MGLEILWSPWRMAFIDPQAGAASGERQVGSGELGAAPEQASEREEKQATPGAESGGCVFCALPARGPGEDRAGLILYRGEHNFVILNLYPYNTGHLMVVPYRHLGDVTLLSPGESAEMMALLQRMVQVVRDEYRPEGFNAGMNLGRVSGAGIADHVHMHLVPRWSGDTNFMPVIGQTKVMPESLETTYDRLRRRVRSGQGGGGRGQ